MMGVDIKVGRTIPSPPAPTRRVRDNAPYHVDREGMDSSPLI